MYSWQTKAHGLKEPRSQTVIGPEKEIQEVKNAYDAYEQISNINPSSMSDLKRIHGIMTYKTVVESGDFRKGNEGVFSEGKCIFVAPPPHMVNNLVTNLLSWINNNENKVHPLILSAVFHYEFVFIHPFSDGNGRMARLWHTVLLCRWRKIFEYIPLESQIEKDFGHGSIMKLGDEKVENIDVIPTGSIGLNAALGVGGYPKGRIIEIYGPESSGKTTLAIHAIAECQKQGGIAAFIDAEHAFDRFYAAKLGVDVDNLYMMRHGDIVQFVSGRTGGT